MVRVISVHNFPKQEITSVDEIVDVATVPPDILLIAQSNHIINVRNLAVPNDTGFNVPTVDQVVQIVYSIQGSYIGCIEEKITRHGAEIKYVRVYVNWENDPSFGPAMRARIAGRVTPLSQNMQGLELVEIPTSGQPSYIACCPVSGNLLVSSKKMLSIYKFMIQTHDISKMQFIDFQQLTIDLELSFTPTKIKFVENMIAAQNDEYLHVFLLEVVIARLSSSERNISIDDFERLQNRNNNHSRYKTIDYQKLIKENNELKYYQWYEGSNSSTSLKSTKWGKNDSSDGFFSSSSELAKADFSSFPLQHDFPTVLAEKSILESKFGNDMFHQNPFTICKDLSVHLINITPLDPWDTQYRTSNILQYKLTPLLIGSTTNKEMHEKFTCLSLKPYYEYKGRGGNMAVTVPGLQSPFFSDLKCLVCFIATQQEGYLHCIEYITSETKETVLSKTCTVYPFTAPVVDVVLEDSVIHTLTDSGLETYTLRGARHLLRGSDKEAAPSAEDPICLIGLRPFLKVSRLSVTNHHLTLFASNEETSVGRWTLYHLNLPSPSAMFADFLNLAEENKWEAPATYCHMVGEGNLILKTYLNIVKWVSMPRTNGSHVSLATPQDVSDDELVLRSLYQASCALLGDHFILNSDFEAARKYYSMSGEKTSELIKRIEGLYENVPVKYHVEYEAGTLTRGLLYILKKTLEEFDDQYAAFTGNREEFYNPEIGNLVTTLMDLLEKEDKSSVSDLVLGSFILREFSTDRILKIIKNLLTNSASPQDKDALSLSLMCIERGQSNQAKTVLQTMDKSALQGLLLAHRPLLFEKAVSSSSRSLSELSKLLLQVYPSVLASVLSVIVLENSNLKLNQAIQIFINILPSGGLQAKNSTSVLQTILENYFKHYFENLHYKRYDTKTIEALKILVRTYLSELQQLTAYSRRSTDCPAPSSTHVLFADLRPSFYDVIPPLGPDFNQILSPQHGLITQEQPDSDLKLTLLKLQSLLSFEDLPEECNNEVKTFLVNQSNVFGSLSLQIASSRSLSDITKLLLNFAPQAFTAFAKERIQERSDWRMCVSQVQNKIMNVSEDSRRKFYYEQILSDTLLFVAESMSIEDLVEILPQNYEGSERYLSIAQNNAQANHIKTLIMVTGKQLLGSL